VLVPVLREGVTNILRHSNASHCAIEMTATAGLLRLQISTDGSLESPTETDRSAHDGQSRPAEYLRLPWLIRRLQRDA
jgi:two-component system sensor histidine kinase DesK